MNTTIRALIGAGIVVAAFGVAVAKLPPAPPLTDAQKAEKAAKDEATAKHAKEDLAKAEDKAVANYKANMAAKGKSGNASENASHETGQSGGGKGLPSQPEKASNAYSPPKK
jgi:hypothetical protein